MAQDDKRWLHNSTAEHEVSAIMNLAAVKDFAYNSFDLLDKDSNGYLEPDELEQQLESDQLSSREKSFVQFLLNNREQIAGMADEEHSPEDGISRSDLELYFELLADLL